MIPVFTRVGNYRRVLEAAVTGAESAMLPESIIVLRFTVIEADRRQVVYVLSDALDLVGVDDVAHGKRVGAMTAECGKGMGMGLGLPVGDIQFLIDLVLPHDIDVSSTNVHHHVVNELDWGGYQKHAPRAHELLEDVRPLARCMTSASGACPTRSPISRPHSTGKSAR